MTDLTSYTTFAVKAACRQLISVTRDEDFSALLPLLARERHWILGGGSNVLFTRDFDGIVVRIATCGITVAQETDKDVIVEVAAGEPWENFVNFCLENRFYGVENLIGIPGLTGSCPVQNIGAYGAEVKDVIACVEGYRISTGKPFHIENADCAFGYRTSIFKTEWKNDVVITRVRFRLWKQPHYNLTYKGLTDALVVRGYEPTLENIARTVDEVRRQKLPDIREVGCAGSFFKNPIVDAAQRDALRERFPNLVSYPAADGRCKLAAGQLIDLTGLKGFRQGQVGVWPHQALVIVNYGGATGDEVRNFYEMVQCKVSDFTGVRIEPEVNIL